MKKLLIGCGVILILLLGAAGYFIWKIAPSVQEAMRAADAFQRQVADLEERYPYDAQASSAFERERFATAMALRGRVRGELRTMYQRFEELEDEDTGVFEKFDAYFDAVTEPLEAIVALLEDARMSLREFGHHVLTFWAAAKSAHDGLGDQQALAELRDDYVRLALVYERQREEAPRMKRLSSLLEPVSPEQVAGARDYLEEHRELSDFGDLELTIEVMMLQLNDPDSDLAEAFGAPAGLTPSETAEER